MSLADSFTALQTQAIEHEEGPMEVMAGPGTGKTRVMVERIARLIEKNIAWKHDILCIAFTRKDVTELRERMEVRLQTDTEFPIFTFHAFGKNLLTAERSSNGGEKALRIFDPEAAFRLLQRAMREARVDETAWSPWALTALINEAKENGIAPEMYLHVDESPNQRMVAKVYQRYQEMLDEQGGCDLADLIYESSRLIESRPDLQAQLHQQYRFVTVDEWQDTSSAQYRLLRLLIGPKANLFVVGSEAQSIYEWRQANYPQLLAQFLKDFPDAKRLSLKENFRSRLPIVASSRALFDFSPRQYSDIDLLATRGEGELVQDVRVPTEQDEAMFIVSEAKRLHDDDPESYPWDQIAVLYRANVQARVLEQEFLFQKVPYALGNGQRMYQRREVRDLLTFLEIAATGSQENISRIINSPPRGLGSNAQRLIKGESMAITFDVLSEALALGEEKGLSKRAVEALQEFYEMLLDFSERGQRGPSELLTYIFARSGYERFLVQEFDGQARRAVVDDLIREAQDYDTSADFLAAIRRKTSDHDEFVDGKSVVLSTIHASKGLQWKAVFVAGMEEGILPNTRADDEGERRLAYVAMTRAIDRLYLVSAKNRERNGKFVATRPSRFLYDLPTRFVEQHTLPEKVERGAL